MERLQKKPCVLHVGYNVREDKHVRKLEGVKRFAWARGLEVEALTYEVSSPSAIRSIMRKRDVVGCIVEASCGFADYPASLFGKTPTIYLDPSEPPALKGVKFVICNDEAIASTAFRELSAGLPPCYAVATYRYNCKWAHKRTESFKNLCSAIDKQCAIFPEKDPEEPESRARRLSRWVASLPDHCAIFAVNDYTAHETAVALAECRRTMPRSATLIGVDGLSTDFGDGLAERISSVKIDLERAGFLAARLLIEGGTFAMFDPLMVIRRESTRGRGRRAPHVMEAVEIIRREACDGLTAAALAMRVPGSRKHFERRFREAMGHSVLDEILHVRLEQVQAILARKDIAIDAIAGMCGFGSEIELRRLFRRRFGMSMTEWRTRHLY